MVQTFNPAGLADNPALKSQLEAQVGLLGALSLRSCDTLQRVSELNMKLARELLDDGFAACRDLLSCKDPMKAAATAMRALQPAGERLGLYQHKLFGVFAEAQANLPSAVAAQPARRGATGARPG